MIQFLIDTSSKFLILALYEDEKELSSSIRIHENALSSLLFKELERLFKEAGIKKEEVDVIAFGKGPGSYTGTRVGASVAKTLSFALRKPLIALASSLFYIEEKEGLFYCVFFSKASLAFGIKGDFDKEIFEEFSFVPQEELFSLLEKNPPYYLFTEELFPPLDSTTILGLIPSAKLAAKRSKKLFLEGRAANLALSYFQEIP